MNRFTTLAAFGFASALIIGVVAAPAFAANSATALSEAAGLERVFVTSETLTSITDELRQEERGKERGVAILSTIPCNPFPCNNP